MSKSEKRHWQLIKCIFRYLKSTSSHGTVFSCEESYHSIVRYVYLDYVSDIDDMRSITEYIFTLAGELISWKSSVKSIMVMSTIKTKFMAAGEDTDKALCHTIFVRNLYVEKVEFN